MARTRTIAHSLDADTVLFTYRRNNPATGSYYTNVSVTAVTVAVVDTRDGAELLGTTAMVYDAAIDGYRYVWTHGGALSGRRTITVKFRPTRAGGVAAALVPDEDVDHDLADALEIETGITPRQAERIVLASQAGKLSGAGTSTIRIRNITDTKDVIVGTVDGNGNRTTTVVDGS